MSESVYFVVEGNPVPKGRPRFNKDTGAVYTPTKTKTWERIVAWKALETMQGREPMIGDITLAVVIRRGDRRPVDADNILKNCMDACNGILWKDDRQVTSIYVHMVKGHKEPGISLIAEKAA